MSNERPFWPRTEPFSDRGRLVGGVVVHNRMDIELGGNAALDLAQEFAKLKRAMAEIAAAR